MSFKQWLVLLALCIAFMIAGAAMFLYLELWYEYQERESLAALKHHVLEVVGSFNNDTKDRVEVLLWEIGEECGHDFMRLEEDTPLKWTLWNSFFFTFTVITTIGFGHMAPKTVWGRIACILYAFIGVPLNGILVASLADIFYRKVMHWDVRQWAARYKSWVTVLVDAIVFLVPGLLVFLVLPSLVVMAVEDDWTYLDAFYFSFITLTTIGFGDHVAGQQERDHVWVWVYKVVMVVWIVFGLGYLIMIITFIQNALKSKRILKVERKMTTALKKHVARVHRDLGAVRLAINNNNNNNDDNNNNNNRVYRGRKAKKRDPTTTITTRHPPPTTPPQNVNKEEPSARLAPFSRPRSASESDLLLPYMTRRRELEGMNVMLDFIERLLYRQETRALTTFRNLLHHHHYCQTQQDYVDDEEEGGSDGEDGKRGCDNCGFEGDAGGLGGLGGLKDVFSSQDRKGTVEELLYLMLLSRGEYPLTDLTQLSTLHPPANLKSNQLTPHSTSTPRHPLGLNPQYSPPPNYSSITPTSPLSLYYSTAHSLTQSPHQSITPSPHRTLTLLGQLFHDVNGRRSPFTPSNQLLTPSSTFSTPSTTPPRPHSFGIAPDQPPAPSLDDGEATKL